ncbi:MAG: type II toxin-antitoxin system RelE/ParE family toxin [Candidatus Methylumidiphilus sp.]
MKRAKSILQKPIHIRPLANTDIDDITDYIALDSIEAATRFLNSVEQACARISEQPGIGALRYAKTAYLDGLRFWPVPTFDKYLVFYLERPDYIDVLRVLHGARDIPNILMDSMS